MGALRGELIVVANAAAMAQAAAGRAERWRELGAGDRR